ncbi:MAG TPA: nitroreductase family protein [Solirubrobacteraceae bacterium]|nr:nitroreductase family protein [Solirubrobacteraceae bacterium]
MSELEQIIRSRHSERVPFDRDRCPPELAVEMILDAARWAPSAHNMQNFEIVVVDDETTLDEIGRVPAGTSAEFVRENYEQLSFSEEELISKGTGLLATMFPPAWRTAEGQAEQPGDFAHGFLDQSMRSCPLLMVVLHDRRRRAPASAGDMLGIMSLGCVMQNMWLTAESLGIGMQILSVFSSADVEQELRRILSIPPYMAIAFACRLGYPATKPAPYLRVRRELDRFVHRNTFARPQLAG